VETVGTPLLWGGFAAIVIIALVLDLGVFHKRAHRVSMKEAGIWTAVWVGLSLAAAGFLAVTVGPRSGTRFLTAWLVEKALSVDNLFVFAVIFQSFRVPARLQHRVLFWGILGAVVMRGVFVAAGAALVQRFDWVLYVFGAFLVITGMKLLLRKEDDEDDAPPKTVDWLRRLIRVEPDVDSGRFFTGRRATTLFLVLLVIELADVVFAADSIPAVFGITDDPFIVYTSNVFAILGLRAIYFLLAGLLERWRYLSTGLALVLLFIGAKMLVAERWHVGVVASLGTIVGILLASAVASWAARRRGLDASDHPG
jgi:tellurite resistance protein TerC